MKRRDRAGIGIFGIFGVYIDPLSCASAGSAAKLVPN